MWSVHCHDEVITEESADNALDYKLLEALCPRPYGGHLRCPWQLKGHEGDFYR
jgi:hypothetical protein